jgi:hypothetical protein
VVGSSAPYISATIHCFGGNFIAPDAVPLNKIYDPNQERFNKFGLQFRHTDNINKWIHSLEAVKLPKVLLRQAFV